MVNGILTNVVVFLVAAVAVVPLAKRLRLGSVLGYLIAGLLIGPGVFGIIPDAEVILHFAEFGVVLLLFLIGLELKPRRLWELRRSIVGAGVSQLVATALVLGLVALALGASMQSALVIGLVLALSSTAFALQIMTERRWNESVTGKTAFSILLFQDIAVIPLLAVIPFLGSSSESLSAGTIWLDIGRAAAVIVGILVLGPRVARPLFRIVAATASRELFTALSLLIVIGMALLVSRVGLSMALGAFIGGVLLADSEYRHELEIDIEPFKGLLMGLFFMAVGMSMDLSLVLERPVILFGLTLALVLIKFGIVLQLGRMLGVAPTQRWQLAGLLCQGGEFGFVVFGAAATAGVMPQAQVDMLTAVIVLSMVMTPVVMAVAETVIDRMLCHPEDREADEIDDATRPVIIAGFGRYGQVVARLLNANAIDTTVIDHDPVQIELLRRLGHTVYYGDATRLDLLRAAGAANARLLIVALDDPEATLRLVDLAREHFPSLALNVRVRNRSVAYELLDRGIENFERETFAAALNTGTRALIDLGFDNERAFRAANLFRNYDEAMVRKLLTVRRDAKQLPLMVAQARDDLERLMQSEAGQTEVRERKVVGR